MTERSTAGSLDVGLTVSFAGEAETDYILDRLIGGQYVVRLNGRDVQFIGYGPDAGDDSAVTVQPVDEDARPDGPLESVRLIDIDTIHVY